MTENRPLNGQDIGQASIASRAVLERLLADVDLRFEGWVALNTLSTSIPALSRADLAERLVHGILISPDTAERTLADLADRGLTSTDSATPARPRLSLTTAGGAMVAQLREGMARIAVQLYGGLPEADLVTAQRVLAVVTERAKAELAR